MNTVKYCSIILGAGILAGCATHSDVAVTEPVGPDLRTPRVDPEQGRGRLMVYSATEIIDQVNGYFPTHSAYTIYDSGGSLLRRVDNRTGSFEQTPVAISLPAGHYSIEARAVNEGAVRVPVIIEQGKTTTVDLEGSHLPQHKPSGAGQWVRLPDGKVIGMRLE